jgi:hypothetical protein
VPVITVDAYGPFDSQKENTGALSDRYLPCGTAGTPESVQCPENPCRVPFQEGFRERNHQVHRHNHFHEPGFPNPE